MFRKTGSCSTLYFCLVVQITSYENKEFRVMCIIHVCILIFEVKFQEKSSYYTQRVNRFICNMFYMIHSHSSNSVLRSEVG